MKHIFKCIVVICFAFFISCANDDDEAIRGAFVITVFEIDTALDFDNNGVASNNLMNEIGCYPHSTIFLGTNSYGTSRYLNGEPVYRERIDVHSNTGITKLVTCDVINSAIEFIWTREGNNVTITSEGFNVTGILSEGDTKFEFVIEDGFTFRIVNDAGVEVEVTEDVTCRYILEPY
jgi:hypothetical protein